MDELNRKIAEWVGFEEVHYLNTSGGTAGIHWSAPDKVSGGPSLPDFTSDFNALFKWVVPRLFSYEFENAKGNDRGHEAFVNYGEPLGFEGYSALAETPALALCCAVIKLIDASEDKERAFWATHDSIEFVAGEEEVGLEYKNGI